jgi:hypothetical protein
MLLLTTAGKRITAWAEMTRVHKKRSDDHFFILIAIL